jgi:hypothetical protein
MFVDIKDAPHFVMGLAAFSALLTFLVLLSRDCALNKGYRRTIAFVNVDDDLISAATPPELEVAVLGSLALDEYQDLANLLLWGASWSRRSSPAVSCHFSVIRD